MTIHVHVFQAVSPSLILLSMATDILLFLYKLFTKIHIHTVYVHNCMYNVSVIVLFFYGCNVDVSNIVLSARTSAESVVAASVACLTASL